MAAYIVLARKWRPHLFKEVVAQSHVITTLQNALSANRLSHAYIFSGPRGIGKTTVARILAKAVNCMEKSEVEPCNSCKTCNEISSGRSIDVIEIDAASNRGIDEIRELRDNVKFAPVSCKYKIYIIDEVHMLTPEAFNALLKTLEDPPGHVIFILATTERHKIPETILSRCQQFDFRRMSYLEIVERLKEICHEEQFAVSDQALELIARQSEGCLRDAEVALDQLVSYSNGPVNLEDVSALLGLGSHSLFEQLVHSLVDRQSAQALKTLNLLATGGADLNRLLNSLISHFRDLMIIKIHPEPKGLIDVSDSMLAELQLQADRISLQRLKILVRLLMKAAKDARQFGYEQVNLECCLIEICQIPDGLQIDEALSKLVDLQEKLSQISSSYLPIAPNQPSADIWMQTENETPTYTHVQQTGSDDQQPLADSRKPADMQSVWSFLLDRVKLKEKRIYALIERAKPLELGAETFIIGFSGHEDFLKEQLDKKENRQVIESELSQILSKKMTISLMTSENINPMAHEADETKTSSTDSQLLLMREAINDDRVQLVLNIFGGDVVDVKSNKQSKKG